MFRKLVEDDKIDEQKYNSDGQAIDNEPLDVQFQDKKENSTYYVSFLICLLQIIILFLIIHGLKLVLQNNRKNICFMLTCLNCYICFIIKWFWGLDGNYFKIV